MSQISSIFLLLLLTACTQYVVPDFAEDQTCYSDVIDYSDEVVTTRYIHQYGVTVPKYQWEESGKKGQIVTTNREGVTRSATYYYGVLEGDTSYTFPFNTAIEKVETYSQDTLIQEKSYYPSGKIRTERTFHPSEPIVSKEWYENGKLKSFEKHAGSLLSYAEYYDMEGNRTSEIDQGVGLKTMRDTYGLLWGTQGILDGQKTIQTTYHSNRSPKEIDPYKNGLVHGLRKTYYAGGEPNTIENWIEGKQEGITTVFKDGEKFEEIPYKQGRKNGVGKIYADGTQIVQEISWKDDQKHGPCRTHIQDRTITEWYFKGDKVSKGYYDSFDLQRKPVETVSEEVKHLSEPSLSKIPSAEHPNVSHPNVPLGAP